ncbi:norsolorinic acid reductase [Rhizodiscina lignyota]|uniref:Norsolorinic acid reductase n=1 Tax=Rhizodiscina lignyota TaxID=1504668 RepID=A0A9P4IA72_9PEZI|nr:norsolorinic acid reductase [Rhizodiscina lignyota]
MAWNSGPAPKSLLERYRVLSPTASVRVSPICLGAMNFGGTWKHMGICTKDTAFEMLDYFFSQGGNFIDTAVNYQDGESEIWLGEWLSKHNVRDQMVIATKYTTNYQAYLGTEGHIHANFGGNSIKNLHTSVETSLKRLRTNYIDLLYVHWWDHATTVQELMLSLNDLVRQGKVLYLGISDAPAWFVAKCNEFARCNGLRQFVVYQGQWSAANRSFERDILQLCEHDGMSIAPWGVLGGGQFKTEAQVKATEAEGRKTQWPSANAKVMSEVLEKVAKRKNTQLTAVALAYVMHKAPYVFPICGGRKVEHLKGNIDALALELSAEDIKEIEGAAPFDLGFPTALIGQWAGENSLMNFRGTFDYVDRAKPIPASQMTLSRNAGTDFPSPPTR